MFPDLDFIKTSLNAITAKFRSVQSNVDAVRSDVDAVKANVDLVDQKSTKCLYVKLENGGYGLYALDTAPKDIIKHIQSGGNVYIQYDENPSQLDVVIVSEEPVCLILYTLTEYDGFLYFVWDTEDLTSWNDFHCSRYLNNVYENGSLRYNNSEITTGSGYMSESTTITDWTRSTVPISHNNSESADTYILIDFRNASEIAGVRFNLALNVSHHVPLVDYDASDHPSVLVRYVLLHITTLNSALCHFKEIFYGETLDALEYKSINTMLYCADSYGYSFRGVSTSGKYTPTSYRLENNVDVTTYIL